MKAVKKSLTYLILPIRASLIQARSITLHIAAVLTLQMDQVLTPLAIMKVQVSLRMKRKVTTDYKPRVNNDRLMKELRDFLPISSTLIKYYSTLIYT